MHTGHKPWLISSDFCTATILQCLIQLVLLSKIAMQVQAASTMCYNGTGDQTTDIIPCIIDAPVSVCCNVTDICM